ncbi:kinase-like domain-containing protein [Vararia minispora EC-137]|uniref:Kinase-like domain-containing protein n=1 Tax=Vararia minispora EC-137 TaxID=1314806 RepID=A0ACB8QA13_9AGAM|nr:kinase-like domain-containing protein [Vararia minispora EC-137]
MSTAFLDAYEPLDIIGNGSFGVIRKVRRKSDGSIFARKELNFERMNERDRKQIVAEVNILKDLNHDHIVRYIDRHVDRDAGILYIIMEYCGGGDLSAVIKAAQRTGRPIAEEMIWSYFMQILLALQHCHHPNGHARTPSASDSGSITGSNATDGKEKRAQVLHRDLKPDNVFLNESNLVKLGDFGLSKALPQASLASTYVGTPYYMSPEVMQEKTYDSKSDIWSLGCLIYELCALHPPFHEAKTHAQLSILIQNGRIPPLPRGYSQALWSVIKAMLNLNPAMRPSATQLLQHERVDLAHQCAKAQSLFNEVKAIKANLQERERNVLVRETALSQREAVHAATMKQHETEIASLQARVTDVQATVSVQIQKAIVAREDELRIAVLRREEEVAAAMQKREEEILAAVHKREQEIEEAWRRREMEIREESERETEERWREEWERLDAMRREVEDSMQKLEEAQKKSTSPALFPEEDRQLTVTGRRDKAPLEEVKNILEPLSHFSKEPTPRRRSSAYVTPQNTAAKPIFPLASAMKGVILTSSGEALATPTPSELAKFFVASPKASFGFAKIFGDDDSDKEADEDEDENQTVVPTQAPVPRSPTKKVMVKAASTGTVSSGAPSSSTSSSQAVAQEKAPATTRLRRPSTIRPSSSWQKLGDVTESKSAPGGSDSGSKSAGDVPSSVGLGRPQTARSASTPAEPVYDLDDEDNLPSPFLKKTERLGPSQLVPVMPVPAPAKKRPSAGNMLRAFAAANNAAGRGRPSTAVPAMPAGKAFPPGARRAGEEARKALLRT